MARNMIRTAQAIFDGFARQGPSFEGLLRRTDNNTTVEFSLGKIGSDWIVINVRDIDDVVALDQHTISDRIYDFVRIRLHVPKEGPALTFARLAAAPRAGSLSGATLRDSAVLANNLIAAERFEFRSVGRCWDSARNEWYNCPPYRD